MSLRTVLVYMQINIMDLITFIQGAGSLGVAALVFAESGLFIGFFLPGDSLLFTAGILASQGYMNILILILLTFPAAVLGDNVGYAFGKKVGPRIFRKQESVWFNPDQLRKANVFFMKHGAKAIVLARFMPVIRTFTPILAGAGDMPYKKFLVYNLIGGAIWAIGIPLAGYYLGSAVPDIDKYILPIIVIILLSSVLPAVPHLLRSRKHKNAH